jgi:hypothetical protein
MQRLVPDRTAHCQRSITHRADMRHNKSRKSRTLKFLGAFFQLLTLFTRFLLCLVFLHLAGMFVSLHDVGDFSTHWLQVEALALSALEDMRVFKQRPVAFDWR